MNNTKTNIKMSFIDMPQGEPFICSFSGGKDSAIALSMACEKGEARGILHWCDDNDNISMFHVQESALICQQALCMKLPLYLVNYAPWKNHMELLRIYEGFAEQGIKSIIFGDINLEDSVKMQSILCRKAGLTPRYPLWGRSYDYLFAEILKRKIKSIITRVNTAKLSEKWLGKVFDVDTYQEFYSLGIDPFGEKGEFHTTVVEADFYEEKLQYTLNSSQTTNDIVNVQFSLHNRPDNIYKLLNCKTDRR